MHHIPDVDLIHQNGARVRPCRRYGRPICGSTLAKNRSGNFDLYYQTQDDPYLETRACEEQFVQQIVDAVRDALRETMPVFLAGCMTGMAQNPAAVSPQLVKEPVKDSINWDFVGG